MVLAGCAAIGEFQDQLTAALTVDPPPDVQPTVPAPDEPLATGIPLPKLKPPAPARFASLPPNETTQGAPATAETVIGDDADPANNTVQLAYANSNPDRLIGAIPGEIITVLGEPSQRLQEPPAEIWQYNSASCTLRLTLLLDVVTEEHRSVFYEVKSANPEVRNGDRNCVAELLAARRARS